MKDPAFVSIRCVLALLPTILLASGPTYADTITDSFDGVSLNPSLWSSFTLGNASVSQSGGKLILTASGRENTDTVAAVILQEAITGDFDIQVGYQLLSGTPSVPSSFPALIFITDGLFVNRGFGSNGSVYGADVGPDYRASTTDTEGKLRLARVGRDWFAYYWDPNTPAPGWRLLGSGDPNNDGALSSFALAVVTEGPGDVSVALDDFSLVTAVPEPTSLVLLGTGLLGAARAWRKRRA